MNLKKIALFALLGAFAAQTYAADSSPDEGAQIPVETYSYSTKLDIARVIFITEPANECAPVPSRMTYEDSKGQLHILQYQVMGTGCSNG